MNDYFTEAGFELSDEEVMQFEKLYALFVDWNSKINLSSIRDETGIYQKHFVDSILVLKYFDLEDKDILDLGSGGGFPALPLGIALEDSKIVALDSVGKKMKAVSSMADKLGINVKTEHGRIEDFGSHKNYRGKFDIVVARALAPWPVLLEYTLPFLKLGGSFIAYQGPAIESDLKEFKGVERKLGGKIQSIHKTQLGENERVFVEVKKVAQTPTRFPRSVGIPRQKPLK